MCATKPAEHELEFIIPHATTYNSGEASAVLNVREMGMKWLEVCLVDHLKDSVT